MIWNKIVISKHHFVRSKRFEFVLIATVLATMLCAVGLLVEDHMSVLAEQYQENRSSVPHDAKGHESHQVIIFQNSTDGLRYSGTLAFNLSKPADIISFEEITDKQSPNITKVWEVGNKTFAPKTIIKNVTQGNVIFEGSGLVAHNTNPDTYNSTFIINETSVP